MAHTRNPFAKPAKPHARNPFAKTKDNGKPKTKGRSVEDMAAVREAKARKRTEEEQANYQATLDSIPVMQKRIKEAGKTYDKLMKEAHKAKTVEDINAAFNKLDGIQNEIINLTKRIRQAERMVAA